MARQNNYQNTVAFEADETSLKRLSHKRTLSILTSLALLAFLLAISLIAMAILYFQKERKLEELEEVVEKIRASLWLSNVRSKEALDNVHFLENISTAFSEIQARLEKANASRTAAQGRYRNLLGLVSTGWKFYDGNFYYFTQVAKSWQDAEKACRSYGAHLSSITSRQEMYLQREASGQTFWIGLTDQQEEGNWTWLDGSKYNQRVSFWAQGQPDNWYGAPGHQEDCVHLAGQWNDVSCTYSYKGICKKVSP
ncbi:C-type lectin domain family 4 member F-like isoform X2 [Sceloporus undulatus]|uniref:C-type lectin domain family 4 member F-like isoform X2 n=1 Tax=Sceloporus undulatus TaxID=8520 RepID=UPI001C4C23C7|nr:C-type lectin domain family 4 member F-like isoform X2 [Sceloporus undulatus]